MGVDYDAGATGPHNLPCAKPRQTSGPISHLGFAVASRAEMDGVAAKAKKAGLLKFGPTFLTPVQVIGA